MVLKQISTTLPHLSSRLITASMKSAKHKRCQGSEDDNQLVGSQIARNLPTAASYEIVPWFSRPNRPLCTCARIVCAGHQLQLYKRQHTRANNARAQNVKYADSHQVHCRRSSRRRKTTCWEIFPTLHVTLFLQSVQHAPPSSCLKEIN